MSVHKIDEAKGKSRTRRKGKRAAPGDLESTLAELRSVLTKFRGPLAVAQEMLDGVDNYLRPESVAHLKAGLRGTIREALHSKIDELLPD